MKIPFACPVCGLPLNPGPTYRCAAGHAFDAAKEGYVNLLRGGPAFAGGDSPDMLRARRSFLGGGWYAPFAEALSEAAGRGDALDAGCGEGYYLERLQARRRAGMDISRAAAAMAARRVPEAAVAVADTAARLPFADGSFDAVLSVFAPRGAAEFARVLRTGGVAVLGLPGPEHLKELSEFGILSLEEGKERKAAARMKGFELKRSQELHRRPKLPAPALRDLLGMLPSGRGGVQPQLPVSLAVTFDLRVMTFTLGA